MLAVENVTAQLALPVLASRSTELAASRCGNGVEGFMKTAAEYRAMADECFKWAREAQTKVVRASYLQLAQVWLDTASKIDGLPASSPRRSN